MFLRLHCYVFLTLYYVPFPLGTVYHITPPSSSINSKTAVFTAGYIALLSLHTQSTTKILTIPTEKTKEIRKILLYYSKKIPCPVEIQGCAFSMRQPRLG